MITELRVRGFRCLNDVSVPLGAVNVLVGPNDAGKSSILDALYLLDQSTKRTLFGEVLDLPRVDDPWTRPGLFSSEGGAIFVGDWALDSISRGKIELGVKGKDASGSFEYELRFDAAEKDRLAHEWLRVDGNDVLVRDAHGASIVESGAARTGIRGPGGSHTGLHFALSGRHPVPPLGRLLATSGKLRWEPARLALPSPPGLPGGFLPNGFGLAGALERVRDEAGIDRWLELERLLTRFAPTVKHLRFRAMRVKYHNEVRDAKAIEIIPHGCDAPVPASQISEGVLMILGFLALALSLNPPAIMLIEEPETGLHPQRIGMAIDLLRRLASETGTQILATTHSPLVVNHLQPEEVLMVSRSPEQGTTVTRFAESAAVQLAADSFDLGELWYNVGDEAIARGGNRP